MESSFVEALSHVRQYEYAALLAVLPPPPAKILEIGAGMGELAKLLSQQGYDVVAIDIPQSIWRPDRLFPVIDYDGVHIPQTEASVDAVISSHVLVQVSELDALQADIKRVLKPTGRCIHILPTSSWRLFTTLAGLAQIAKVAFMPSALPRLGRRGDRVPRLLRPFVAYMTVAYYVGRGMLRLPGSGYRTFVGEAISFSHHSWLRRFRSCGFEVYLDRPLGLFYTGFLVTGAALSIDARHLLASFLGSSSRMYGLTPAPSFPGAETDSPQRGGPVG